MEQIIITRADGTTWSLITKSAVSGISKAMQKRALLGEDIIDMEVASAVALEFNLGDRISVFGSTYTLNSVPKNKKGGSRKFNYNLTWEGRQYDMLKALYLAESEDGISISPDWSLAGDLSTFIDILINNLNRVYGYGKWEKGLCPDIDTKVLTYSNENCLAALQNLCSEENFNKEFEITESGGICILNIKDAIGQNLLTTYKYGRAKGLYNLTRQTVSDKNIVTRLYVFGSDKNLPSDYRGYAQRLKLPGNDKSFIEDPSAVAAYGLIEGVKIFDEVFPRRIGTISALGASIYEFIDDSMDFDLTATDSEGNTIYLLNETSAKVHFNTGNLAGYEFDITAYDHSTKKFTIKAFADERGQAFPDVDSVAFQMSVGDEYVIVEIMIPQTYIDNAETELDTKGNDYYSQNCKQPKVQYGLAIDQSYLKSLYPGSTIVNVFGIGDYLNVQDSDLNVDKAIRIKSFTRNVLEAYDYALELSDVKEPGTIQRLLAANIETEKVIAINRLRDVARAKRNWKSVGEVYDMVFDTDGYFDGTRIRPETIETLMAIIGVKSQALTLDSIVEPNYQGDPDVVNVGSGTLSHFGIESTIRDWIISAGEITLLDAGAYYIYAKCLKTGNTGIILLSQSQIKVDDDANYYHFLLGILNSEDEGVRWIYLTYGITVINGRFIRTGKLISQDGLTYFDLDSGEIGGRIVFGSGSSGYDNLSDKPDLSDMATETYVNGIRDLLQDQIDGQIISWFYDYDPTTGNLPASDWTTEALKEEHANDTFTNITSGECWRWQYNGSSWEWGVISDTAAQQALLLAQQAQDTADGKRRVFVSQPVTPYDAGDLWTDGTSLKRCNTQRLTGDYTASDWGLATNYDRTQTVIDNGLITTGRIEVGSGNLGDANAGMDGAVSGTPADDIRFWAGASYANRANAPYRVKNDGASVMKGVVEFGTLPADIGSILQSIGMLGADLWENSYDGDSSAIHLNRKGYNGGATKFRDVVIYDGKGHKVFALVGAATPAIYMGNEVDPISVNVELLGTFKLNGDYLRAANNHQMAVGTSSITCAETEGDMDDMSITYTPKGTKAFIMFSAPFHVTTNTQGVRLFINIGGNNVREQYVGIYGLEQVISFQHIADVTPGTSYTVKMRWIGTTNIIQRGTTDSERILTIIDLL